MRGRPDIIHFNDSGKYWVLRILCGRGRAGSCGRDRVTCLRCLELLRERDAREANKAEQSRQAAR